MLLWLWPRKPVVYQSLEEKGDEKGDENTLSHAREPTPSHWVRDTFWALLACFFASTTVWLWWLLNYGHGNYKHGFDTELGLVLVIIVVFRSESYHQCSSRKISSRDGGNTLHRRTSSR